MPKPFPHSYFYNEGLKSSYLLAKSGGKHMAVYRNVQVNFWQDEFILDLTPEERYFYIYLLTGTKTKQCGIYILPKRVAELSFSGAPIGYEDEEDVCVFDIQFYKAGTVNRGSYEYDEIDDERRIVPKEVDKRFFSEMLYDVQVATGANLGHNESWRSKR
ncbi:TPA: MolR family transcriptional regulator [Bacillus thuringiensis]|uniref:MolR family transcriptional regulator n=3 Tax=Bacillus thuringiensis TaxID=1428 RepID=A0AAP4V3T8_BACTU|nr:Molybdate metabolism regulator [Bacillus thuringiensis Bt407]EEM65519.1 Molybdate metabolism regulator [Bacillus thuringiensis serovar berliner ATCC 10792]MBN6706647.1 MolR family transcriptional regulator [Bacillus thuringiensis]MDN7080234.1 MolR family transcriptional regulator [Bacillus thuringiensis]MDQ7258563.1 MolR family transcriptional regulator [Bacillus thuringiensis]